MCFRNIHAVTEITNRKTLVLYKFLKVSSMPRNKARPGEKRSKDILLYLLKDQPQQKRAAQQTEEQQTGQTERQTVQQQTGQTEQQTEQQQTGQTEVHQIDLLVADSDSEQGQTERAEVED